MSRIYLCFVWHMHQPFYKDLISGEYKMPWTRLHALKDYYGMVRMSKDFPEVHQTFNIVPSMMLQVEEYAAGKAADPLLELALKPAEDLTPDEQTAILRGLFPGNPARLIYRYPRYGELYDSWLAADRRPERAKLLFSAAAYRDLQVLSQLAWFDEEFAGDAEVRELARKGRDFTLEDQRLAGRKEREILNAVLPVYREFAARGQIEVSTTPFYHPILPLLCDSDVAAVSHPRVPLPTRFRYPGDAREQLARSRKYMHERFGAEPQGVWPSEGSVSDEALGIAAELGFRWAATDNGVLSRTLGRSAGVAETYRPYRWCQGQREIRMLFRDHTLSDLIGFVYQRLGAAEAAADFMDRLRENCRPILASGRDALVPIILDGENAWEYYDENGRPFLRELYRRISDDKRFQALSVSEALARIEPDPLDHIFPGSWINANFDIWIGAEEDNRAWEHLLRARETYAGVAGAGTSIPEDRRRLAFEELLIAEGSDWCWWYGPEHSSDYRREFDELYRAHLTNVYRAMGLNPPDELSTPILKLALKDLHVPPASSIRATIDGDITSYFEWLGAGSYRVDPRSGAMHGKRFLVREIRYGSDGKSLFLMVDFETGSGEILTGAEARFRIQPPAQAAASSIRLRFENGQVEPVQVQLPGQQDANASEFAFRRVLEARVSLEALGIRPGQALRVQIALWKDGLPLDVIPQQGWIEMSTAEAADWPL